MKRIFTRKSFQFRCFFRVIQDKAVVATLLLAMVAIVSIMVVITSQSRSSMVSRFSCGSNIHASSSADNSAQASGDWAMFGGTVEHTSTVQTVPALGIGPLWSSTLGKFNAGGQITSTPAIVDGRLYVGSDLDSVVCLDATSGNQVWSYKTPAIVESSPAVVNGYVYVGCDDYHVYCLNAITGAFVWSYPTADAVISSPTVLGDSLFVGSGSYLYSLNATTGAELWSYFTRGFYDAFIYATPAIAMNRVYVNSFAGTLICLNATSGTSLWNCTIGWPSTSPAISDGRVYAVGDQVFCLNASTGQSIWNYTRANSESSPFSPAIADGCVYVGNVNLYCLNATTGACIWTSPTINDVESSPAVANGYIYVDNFNRPYFQLSCVDAFTGALKWVYNVVGGSGSSIAIAGGYVYQMNEDDEIINRLPMLYYPSVPFTVIIYCIGFTVITFSILAAFKKKSTKDHVLKDEFKHTLIGVLLLEFAAFSITFSYFLSETTLAVWPAFLGIDGIFLMWGLRYLVSGIRQRQGWKVGRGFFDFQKPSLK